MRVYYRPMKYRNSNKMYLAREVVMNPVTVGTVIYDNIELNGITRSEFIIVDGNPHILETNTIPGFTKQSIIPQQIEAQGLSVKEVINNQIKSIL